MRDELLLKWGGVKGYCMQTPENAKSFELLQKYYADGMPMSAAADKPDDARKEILCELIDNFHGPIRNDWSGKDLTKEDAKQYVRGYGK